MPIAFQPGLEAIGMRFLPETVYIVVSDTVRHQTAEVPEEALALIHRIHDKPL